MHNKLIRRTHIALCNATLTWWTLVAFVIDIVARFGTASVLALRELFLQLAPFSGSQTLGNRARSFLGSLFSVTLEVVCACAVKVKCT